MGVFVLSLRFQSLIFVLLCLMIGPSAEAKLETGTLDGARFTIAEPIQWQKNVLLIAHGYRPENTPLKADLNLAHPTLAQLRGEGWLIAVSSYRRNGLVTADALTDLDNLLDYIVETRGNPTLVLLEGSSMGATIGVMAAERRMNADRRSYDGVLAIGAALDRPTENGPLDLSHEPVLPLLLLSNRSEIQPVAAYATAAADQDLPPVLWRLERDGHVNLNSSERTNALLALSKWVQTGVRPETHDPAGFDATVDLAERPSTAQAFDGGCRSTVHSIHSVYGNMETTFVAADLTKLGLSLGQQFTVECAEESVVVTWGAQYSDVPRGAFVAFFTAEGFLRIACNMDNAARQLGCSAGDPIVIRP